MSSYHILFELLENAGYLKGDVINLDRVQEATIGEMVELGLQSAALTSPEHVPRSQSVFAHSATLSLAGGRHYCSRLNCRTTRAEELGQFAALYSDKVYIHNFLSNYGAHPKRQGNREVDRVRELLADDLAVLLHLRPLIEAERVIPVTISGSCTHCFDGLIKTVDLGSQVTEGITAAGEHLRQRFLSESKITFHKQGNEYYASITAPEDLVAHGRHGVTSAKLPSGLKGLPEVISLLARGRKVPLSKRQMEKYGYHIRETQDILSNVRFELTVSQLFGTSFLTDRPIQISLLQRLTKNTAQVRRNALIKKHLTTLVPFLDGLTTSELLKLRNEEADSFLLFRQALNRTMDEVSDTKSEFTEQQARELYGDVLEPSLARLNLKLHSAQNSLVKSSKRKVVAWVGAISFGLFSGLLTANMEGVAKALGLTKVLSDLAESGLQTRADENVIRNEDMFFLWKVRQASRR